MWNPLVKKQKIETIEIKKEKHRLYDILFEEVDRAGPESVLEGLLQVYRDWMDEPEMVLAKSQCRLNSLVILQAINMAKTINNERFKGELEMAKMADSPLAEGFDRLIDHNFDYTYLCTDNKWRLIK